jgi:hypothetical protein
MMKKQFLLILFLSLTTFLMAQTDATSPDDPYQSNWETIDSLLRRGLPQSAQEQLAELRQQIAEDIKTDNSRYPSLIKATIYELEVGKQLAEDGSWNAIQQLENITAEAAPKLKPIYQSYLAEQYTKYWQENRWQIQNRTQRVGDVVSDDPTSWSAADFVDKITSLYLASIADLNTRGQAIEDIQALLQDNDPDLALLPSVYDLLLHRALEYFRFNDAFLAEPKYVPALNDLTLLGSVDDFINWEMPEVERPTSYYHLLQLLQEALAWSKTERPATLAHLDLNLVRLQLVFDQLTMNRKHAAYEEALQALKAQYQRTELEATVAATYLKHIYQRASAYEAENPAQDHLRWNLQQALTLARDIKKRFPETPAAADAEVIISAVQSASLQVAVEQVQLPEAHALMNIRFRNVPKAYFKLIKVAPDLTEGSDPTAFIKNLLAQKALRSWSEDLPDAGDYREHSTEAILSELAKGKYFLLVSANKDFPTDNNNTQFLEIWSSDLALIQEKYPDSKQLIMKVVSRSTGKPVPNAQLNLWHYRTDSGRSRDRRLVPLDNLTTDSNGEVIVGNRDQYGVFVQLKKGDDELFLRDYLNFEYQYYENKNEPNYQLHFFTDRGLYRPGQTVYFKVLVTELEGKVPQLAPNRKVKVKLMDANRKEVTQLDLRTKKAVSGGNPPSRPEVYWVGCTPWRVLEIAGTLFR